MAGRSRARALPLPRVRQHRGLRAPQRRAGGGLRLRVAASRTSDMVSAVRSRAQLRPDSQPRPGIPASASLTSPHSKGGVMRPAAQLARLWLPETLKGQRTSCSRRTRALEAVLLSGIPCGRLECIVLLGGLVWVLSWEQCNPLCSGHVVNLPTRWPCS